MGRARRAVIIGAQGFRRSDDIVEIECFSWEGVADIPNPSDYDTIILNLISLGDPATVNWSGFFEKFTVDTTREVLINNGHIVIVGDPRFWAEEPVHRPGGEESPGREFLSWTGVEFDWDNRPGRTKKQPKNDPLIERYMNYIDKTSRWDYSLKNWRGLQVRPADIAKVLGVEETGFSSEVELERLCENRYGGLVIFAIRLSIRHARWHSSGVYVPETVRIGRIIFLPAIDMPGDELVAMVLTDILRIQVVVPEPSWASSIVAPGQPRVDDTIAQIKNNIAELEECLKNAVQERERVRRAVRLLYKIGDELEDAVREILALLGATIEPPKERGKEDGWLTVEIGGEILEGVLEVKGTRRDQFSVEGLRQLMEWKSRGIMNRKKNYKGVFVGNSAIEKPLSERELPFSTDWRGTAERAELVALDIRDLYRLYCLHHTGNLESDKFWNALFRTNGVFDITPFLQQ